MSIASTLSNLWQQTAFNNLEWGNYVMILVACVFLYLAIKKGLSLCFWFRLPLVCFWLIFIRTSWRSRMWTLRESSMPAACCTISSCWMSGVFCRP